jgi:hypothetical protein
MPLGAISNKQHVDLNGATGSLDFDPTTGEAPVTFAIVCPAIDKRGVASGGVESGVVFDPIAKRWTGAVECR